MITTPTCCEPQDLSINNTTGYLSISDGNSVYLGTVIDALGIKTPVINYVLNGYLLTLTYTDATGAIQNKTVDLTALVSGGLTTVNTPSLDLAIASGHISGNVNISASSGNTIVINSDGIFSPTVSPTVINTANTTTLDLVNSSNTISGTVRVSASANNQIQTMSDGIFVANMNTYLLAGTNITLSGSGSSSNPYIVSAGGFTNTPINVISTATLSLMTSGIAGHTITGSVNISAAGGNIIVANSDGLYAPASTVTQYTNAMAIAALSSTAPITYNNISGVIGITQAGISSNGYLNSTDWNTFNNKINGATSIGSSASLPIYAGVTLGEVVQLFGLRAGSNVTLQMVGNDLVVSATIPSLNASATLDFYVGDGGPYTPVNGAASMNATILQNKTILGVWIEGVKIPPFSVPGGGIYYTFTSTLGSLALTGGTFTTNSYYSIEYR